MTARTIVGRDPELASIAEFLQRCTSSAGTLLIEGEAGAGKTTIWEAAVAGIPTNTAVLRSRPVETEAAFSFGGLADLIGGVIPDVLGDLPDPQRRALEAALLLETSSGSPQHRAVGAATLTVLRTIASRGPIIVAVDDLQWLDRPSARALWFALRRLSIEPVGLLATRRTDARVATPELAELFRATTAERVRVGPLSVGALGRIVSDDIGTRLRRSTMLRIHGVSNGNPLFALELARALMRFDETQHTAEPLPISDDLQALLLGQVGRLPAASRRALLIASLTAQPTDDVMSAVLGTQWETSLSRIRASGIADLNRGVLRFSHPLLASAVIASSTTAARRTAHRELAEVVHDEEERARHLALGSDGPDDETAARLELASRSAMKRGAPDAAAELAELARALTGDRRDHDVYGRCILAGEARHAIGDLDLALARFEEAERVASPGRERATAQWWLGRTMSSRSDFTGSMAMLERALDEAGGDVELCCLIEQDLAYPAYSLLDLHGTRRHAEVAFELAERIRARNVLAETSAGLATVDFIMGRGVRREVMEQALANEDWDRRRPIVLRPTVLVALVLSWIDDMDTARALLERAERELIDRGDDAGLPFIRGRLAQLDCWRGDWERGLERAVDALRLAEEIDPESIASNCSAAALISAHLGRVDEARAFAEAGIAAASGGGSALGLGMNLEVLGFLEASSGHADRAVALWAPLVERTRSGGVDEPAWLWYLPEFIEALIVDGDLESAESLVEWLDERAAAIDRARGLAAAARCRALLAAARGRVAEGLAACEQALREHERVAIPFEHARTLLVTGQIARRARKWGLARDSLDAACAAFEDLGASLWLDRARSERARIGGRAASRWDLSESEQRVAELVAKGKSNREVAAALFVSPKTVASTLGRVYRKLGVSSRTALAAHLAQGGLNADE